MKYLIFKGDEIILSTDDKELAEKKFKETDSKDGRPSEKVTMYELLKLKTRDSNKKINQWQKKQWYATLEKWECNKN